MPPVGVRATRGNTAFRALTWATPPRLLTGKIFTAALPAATAASTSLGVAAPSRHGTPASRHGGTTSAQTAGETT